MSDRIQERENSLLDRPVLSGYKLTWWTVAYIALMCFIVFTRLWKLSVRGYSHDESIHAWEAWKLFTGQGYSHSPVYHGPFLYHFTALIFALFGHNDLTARLSPVLFGIALTVLPLFMTKWLGKKGALIATLLMAVSPVMMARSRFLRHDPFAIAFNLILVVGLLRYLDKRRAKDLYLLTAALVLGFTAKETTFITYFIFGTFLFAWFAIQWLRDRSRPWTDFAVLDVIVVMGTLILPMTTSFPVKLLGGDPVDYSQQGIIFSGAVFLVLLAISIVIGALWNWRKWLVCAAIFYGIFIPLFTTMFTNGQGFATGMVGQLGYWLTQQEVKRGGQPWYYYLVIMPMYEFLPLSLGLSGTIYYVVSSIFPRRTDDVQPTKTDAPQPQAFPLVAFLIYWFFMAFLMYSWAGEKMPWLMMHLALPLQFLAAWTGARLLETEWKEIRRHGGLWLLLLIPIFVYTLIKMLGNSPFAGTTTAELNSSMAWIASLATAVIMAILISRISGRLRGKDTWRMFALSALSVLLALTIRFAWMATFINADLVTEFLVYAQGSPDVAFVARELETMSKQLTGGLHMKVAYDDDSSWPFVWYLRDYDNSQFYGKKPGGPFDAEVVIVGSENDSAVKPFLGNNYYRRDYRLIWWPNQDWYMNMSPKSIWADIKDPIERKKLWDVLFYRKHEASLTSWPFVHKFAVHVRRDIAQQLWDYGPEAALADTALPGDDYVEKWRERTARAAWGSEGSDSNQFRSPKGIAVDKQGLVYVADSQNHRVQVLDSDGRFIRTWGDQGNALGQFSEPWSVAVGPSGDIYVADTWNHRIQVFDAQGEFKTVWGTFGEVAQPSDSGGVLYGPRDLAFDSQGNLYVTDTGNKRVIKYDPQRQMIASAGGAGSEDGQMQEPVGIATSEDGLVYVVDTWNKRIQVFDQDLRFVRAWPVHAWDGMSVVNKPYLAISSEGELYVTDPEGYRVLKFDDQGELLDVWGQYGSDLSSMNLPTGIETTVDGRILMCDADNHRVLVFSGE